MTIDFDHWTKLRDHREKGWIQLFRSFLIVSTEENVRSKERIFLIIVPYYATIQPMSADGVWDSRSVQYSTESVRVDPVFSYHPERCPNENPTAEFLAAIDRETLNHSKHPSLAFSESRTLLTHCFVLRRWYMPSREQKPYWERNRRILSNCFGHLEKQTIRFSSEQDEGQKSTRVVCIRSTVCHCPGEIVESPVLQFSSACFSGHGIDSVSPRRVW